MPAFVTANSSNKSTQYWIAARLLQAGALLASAFIQQRSRRRWLSKSVLLAAALLIPSLVFAGVTFVPQALPAMFIAGSGVTPLKRYSEYLVIALLFLATAGYWRRMTRTGDRVLLYCLAAFVISIFSELSLVAYTRAFDSHNVLGHLYKTAAFMLIYGGIFITSVKEPYARLAAGEHARHLASFPELNPSPVLEVSRSGEITFFNPATERTLLNLGLDGAQVHLFLPTDIETVLRGLGQRMESTQCSEVTIRGKVFSRTIHSIPRFDVVRIYATDITERKRAEDSVIQLNRELQSNLEGLAAANRELEAFTSSVSHDVRAPLRTMTSFSTLLRQQCAGSLDAKGRGYLERICVAAATMSRTIEDLLRLSRISRQELQREEVDLSAILLALAAELREEHPERPFVFSCDEGITAHADAGLMQAALSNLLRNAWKFTAKKGQARVEFIRIDEGGQTVFRLKDNGAGFDQRYAERLFLPFHRLHSDREFEGTGIGLAIVDRIIRRHGGTIWAEGRENEGAVFSFTLS
jgi:signal transduction histidine kinase